MINIGILCPAEIAYRRFLPALQKSKLSRYIGVGMSADRERVGKGTHINSVNYAATYNKVKCFQSTYGGKIWNSYQEVIESNEVDAIYIPLPPALHYYWAQKALENGKHVLIEKPSTLSAEDSKILVKTALKNRCVLQENYMFIYHKQLKEIQDFIREGNIGKIRLYRISFGFPLRKKNDFRYNRELGGGALYDAGGYVLRLAAMLLGEGAYITAASMNYESNYEVDLYGSGTMENKDGVAVQFAYGMDNEYKCDLEIWGSTGYITSKRILTAPDGFIPTLSVCKNGEMEEMPLSSDDTFYKSLCNFEKCILENKYRESCFNQIIRQAELVDNFLKHATNRVIPE